MPAFDNCLKNFAIYIPSRYRAVSIMTDFTSSTQKEEEEEEEEEDILILPCTVGILLVHKERKRLWYIVVNISIILY